MKTHRGHYYILIIIGCIGFILRVYHLNYHSLWLDEMMQVMVASAEWKDLFKLVSSHSSPPLDYILMKPVILLFGNADWVVRMPALLFGLASIPAFYFFFFFITDRKKASIAATLLIFSPMAIYYSQEARMYSMFLFLSLISYILTLRFIEKNNFKTSLSLGAVNGLLILAHYFGIFVIGLETILLVMLLLFGADKKRRAELMVVNLMISFLIFLPWLPSLLAQINHFGGEVQYALRADRYFFKPILVHFTSGKLDAWLYSYVFIFIISTAFAWRNNEKKLVIVALSMVGLLGMFFGVAFFKRIVTPRNVIFLLPLFLLVCSYGINVFITFLKINHLLGILIVAFLVFWPASRDYIVYRKVNWKGAARYIQQHSVGKEKVVISESVCRGCLAYYLVPEADYVVMRKYWLETINDPRWKIWVINEELIKKIEEKRFSGWVVIPPVASKGVSKQALNKYNKMMGQPVRQFKMGERSLNIYYVQSETL